MQANQANRPVPKPCVRVGLVGCGRVAEFGYLPALHQAAGIKLVGVVDVNRVRCEAVAPGVPAYQSMQDLIKAGGVDGLVIATPTRFHLVGARCAAEAGLPVLLEKPPGVDARETGALLTLNPSPWIAFNRRFEPRLAGLKDRLRSEGKLQLRLALHYRKTSWKSFDMQDDALLDLGPHLIDLTRWLTDGEITQVRAFSLDERRAEFALELDRGSAMISCSNNSPYREWVEAKDSLGRVKYSYKRGGILAGILARLRPHHENPLVTSVRGQLEAFGRVVSGMSEGSPLATSVDGVAVMSAIEAVRYSAWHGRTSTPVRSKTD